MGDLVKGYLVIVSIAIATGHYSDLQKWAAQEAAKPMARLPYFFGQPTKSAHSRASQLSSPTATKPSHHAHY
jgi:hypothetical protein